MTVSAPALEHADVNKQRLRVISPRRGLPNGRALIGAALISMAAVGAYVAATTEASVPTTEYLVITQPIAAGESVTAEQFRFEGMNIPAVVADRAVNSTVGLEGATALRDLPAGGILSIDDLLASPVVDGLPISAAHELSLPVPLDRTPAGLRRGDRVTVLSTLRVADVPTTVVALEDAVVISFDARLDQIGSTGTGVLVLAIPDADLVVSTAHLSHEGDLTIIRSTRATSDTFPPSYSTRQALPSLPSATP